MDDKKDEGRVTLQDAAQRLLLADALDAELASCLVKALEAVAESRPESRTAEAARATIALIASVPEDPALLEVIVSSLSTIASVEEGERDENDVRFPPALEVPDAKAEPAPGARVAPVANEMPVFEPDDISDPELTADFVQEAREHLAQVDTELLKLEDAADDAEAINAVFRAFHTLKGLAGFLELEQVRCLAHETESVLDLARQGKLALDARVMEIVFASNDLMKELVNAVEAALNAESAVQPIENLGAQLLQLKAVIEGRPVVIVAGKEPGPAPAASPRPAATPKAEVTETPAPAAAAPAKTESAMPAPVAAPRPESGVAQAPKPAKAPKAAPVPAAAGGKGHAIRETIKIDAGRLDGLVDLIGELVIAEAMVSQSEDWSFEKESKLPSLLGQLDKITRELQETAMSLRLVPVRATFQRMARIARDVANKLGKPVEFTCEGEDTELDKSVVDALGDPLVHMVRNAIDHGLEKDTGERREAGKDVKGAVKLRAFHRGGSVCVQVCDDGRGLDRDKILARATERGLVGNGDAMSDDEVYQLIFEPGFSTAAEITDVSGRGVGLDVVKKGIEALRGRIEIRSNRGRGSEFTIVLPLTLAIIEGMVIRLGSQRYIIPTQSILRMLRSSEVQTTTVMSRGKMLVTDSGLVPLYGLEELFDIAPSSEDGDRRAVVVVENDSRCLAIVVDELLGQQQIVIKGLGGIMGDIPGLAGGAIMPDGRVGLILDVAALTKRAKGDGTETRATAAPALSRV